MGFWGWGFRFRGWCLGFRVKYLLEHFEDGKDNVVYVTEAAGLVAGRGLGFGVRGLGFGVWGTVITALRDAGRRSS